MSCHAKTKKVNLKIDRFTEGKGFTVILRTVALGSHYLRTFLNKRLLEG